MDDFEFTIDIEDGAGAKLGSGPITSASLWTYTARMDKAGQGSFEMPASDPLAALITPKRRARAWARLGGVWTEVGAIIIDQIARQLGSDGITLLRASGDGEERELAGYSVGATDLSGGGAGVSHAVALTTISAHRTTGWTLTPAAAPGNDFVYGKFAGESTLAALIAVADKTLTHFYRSAPRTLTFLSSFVPSGMRAIQAADSLAAETCAITALTITTDTFDFLTRITPYGSGNGEDRLTIAKHTRTSPAGYTSNRTLNWIRNIAAETAYGVIDYPSIEFKGVRAISNTDADLEAASNALFDLAIKELTHRAALLTAVTYAVALAGCSQLLHPLQTLRLVYRDEATGLDIDADVNILSATWSMDKDGIQTTAVSLSTTDTWPQSDADAVVARITEASLYQAHPQTGPNAYVIPFSKNLDDDRANPAEFRFRFDQEVLQLIRVVFDFKLLPLESTVKSIGGTSTSTTASGDHAHTVTVAAHTHTATTSNHAHAVTIAGHTHTATTSNHTHSVPAHAHHTAYEPGSGGSTVQIFSGGGSPDFGSIVANGIAATIRISTDPATGATTSASNGGQTVTSSSGGSSAPTSASGGGETVTSSSGGSSSPTSASGGSHTHALTASVSTVYGVYRDVTSNVFLLTDLEYSIDGATWFFFIPGVNGYTSLGDSWNRVDLTALLQDPNGFRPLAANNLLQIRRKAISIPIGKLTTIDAQMSIRTTIQSIAFN